MALGAAVVSVALVGAPGVAAARARKSSGVNPAQLVWRRSSAGGAGNLNAIATDGKRFVVVGLVSGLPANVVPIWTSTDGVAWKRAKVRGGTFPARTIMIDVVHQGGRFLAFGEPAADAGKGTLAWTSADGLTWKRYKPKGFPVTATDEPALAATTKDGVALLVGDDATNAYSLWTSKGDTWKSLGPVPASGAPVATLYGLTQTPDGKGFSVGGIGNSQAVAWHSKNGRGWTGAAVAATSPGNFSEIKAVVPFHSGLAALGVSTGVVSEEIPYAWLSKDGKSWTADSGSLPVFMGKSTDGQGMDAGVANGSGVLAAGHDGSKIALWSSADGRSWKRVPDQPRFAVGQVPAVSGVAIARGRVVNLVRIRQFSGQSLNLVDLAIVTGTPR